MHETTPVPTDGSEGATAAAEHATSLAGTSDATRHALRVVDVRTSPVRTETDRDEVVRSLEQSGERPTAPIPDRTEERDTPTTEAIRPEVPRGVRERVDDHDADLLVMGTHGRTGLERTLPGSTTERIVRTVDVPVLTVRLDASGAPGRAGTGLHVRTTAPEVSKHATVTPIVLSSVPRHAPTSQPATAARIRPGVGAATARTVRFPRPSTRWTHWPVRPGHGSGPELRQGTGTEIVPASRNRQSLVVPPWTESRHVRPDTGSDGWK